MYCPFLARQVHHLLNEISDTRGFTGIWGAQAQAQAQGLAWLGRKTFRG